MSEVLSIMVDYLWGMPLVILLIGGGLYLLFYVHFLPMRFFAHGWGILIESMMSDRLKKGKGQLTHFQSLMNALSSTIGMGNIAGVSVAITQGGAGALLWMWVSAIIGMNLKFFECTLSVMYRGENHRGEAQGGAMYVITEKLPKKMHFMAYFFAISGLIGTLALFQTNQLSNFLFTHYSVPKFVVGIICAVFVGVVLFGGVKRLSGVTSSLVPLMCVMYVGLCLWVIFTNLGVVPAIFTDIFVKAFSLQSGFAGVSGYAILQVMKTGVKRAAFSNEAGVGTAPMAHGDVQTDEPVSEGFVAMLGPFIDTIVICTMTALVILIADKQFVVDATQESGILLTAGAFESLLGSFGVGILSLCVLFFSVTTMLGMANYNSKCWDFVFKGRAFLRRPTFVLFFCCTLFLGAINPLVDVVNILDIGYALMAFPNMFVTLYFSKEIKAELIKYRDKYLIS